MVRVYFAAIIVLGIVALGSLGCNHGDRSSGVSYSVGGSVSGLDGTLVLQNNGGDDLTLTEDGSFTFSEQLSDAADFTVTVLTQPSSQEVSITNATGTIASANIISVEVTCTSCYTVGGTVSGLSGTVVLQNNGGDDLTLTSDGSFTFDTALVDGSAYAVTCLTEPINQNVTITSGTGTLSGANISTVTVACADHSWTHPSGLTDNISPDGRDAEYPEATMDNYGQAMIVWLQHDGSTLHIFKSEYR
ncbi:MAG: hypothetical protein ABIK28_07340 [Planctomycetota bacterium]